MNIDFTYMKYIKDTLKCNLRLMEDLKDLKSGKDLDYIIWTDYVNANIQRCKGSLELIEETKHDLIEENAGKDL